jgi:hypothetical protein
LRSGADQHPEDLEPVLLPERPELFDVTIHYDNSSIIEILIASGKCCAPNTTHRMAPCVEADQTFSGAIRFGSCHSAVSNCFSVRLGAVV